MLANQVSLNTSPPRLLFPSPYPGGGFFFGGQSLSPVGARSRRIIVSPPITAQSEPPFCSEKENREVFFLYPSQQQEKGSSSLSTPCPFPTPASAAKAGTHKATQPSTVAGSLSQAVAAHADDRRRSDVTIDRRRAAVCVSTQVFQ